MQCEMITFWDLHGHMHYIQPEFRLAAISQWGRMSFGSNSCLGIFASSIASDDLNGAAPAILTPMTSDLEIRRQGRAEIRCHIYYMSMSENSMRAKNCHFRRHKRMANQWVHRATPTFLDKPGIPWLRSQLNS